MQDVPQSHAAGLWVPQSVSGLLLTAIAHALQTRPPFSRSCCGWDWKVDELVSCVIRETTFTADDTSAGASTGPNKQVARLDEGSHKQTTWRRPQGGADHALPKQLVDADSCCRLAAAPMQGDSNRSTESLVPLYLAEAKD
jgi:hypothetical protein